MCLYCLRLSSVAVGTGRGGWSRHDLLGRVTALGVTVPLAAAASKAAFAAEQSGPAPAEFVKSVKDLVARARSSELAAHRLFEIDGPDMPWTDFGLEATKGQEITFLLTGRMGVSRQYDLWFDPGLVFHARTRGRRPMYTAPSKWPGRRQSSRTRTGGFGPPRTTTERRRRRSWASRCSGAVRPPGASRASPHTVTSAVS
jgi:hypothetical protein